MGQIKLILVEDVPSLGHAGELVSVKPGYARNYLVPQGKAALATEARVQELAHKQRVIETKLAKELSDMQAVAHKIQSLTLEVSAQAGEEGKLFGSVTSQQLVEMLSEKGLKIDRRKLGLSEPIKQVGEHQVPVRLTRDVSATLKVIVSAQASS